MLTDADAAALASDVVGAAVNLSRTGSGGDHRSWWITAGAGRYVLRWALDTRLPGADDETAPMTERTLGDLARFLGSLHAVPLGTVRALGAPDVPVARLDPLRRQAVAAVRELGRTGDLLLPAADEDGPVVLHADLEGEHLLLDGAGGLTAVLDWSDAGTGDPALDVEGLVLAVGADAARVVARGAATPSATVERGVFLARCRSAVRWAAALRGEPVGPEPLLRRQFHRAWA